MTKQTMEIVREKIPESTIEDFAIAHGLRMMIKERCGVFPYTAHFDKAEVRDGCVLRSVYGAGNTEEDAIQDYARQISQRCLVMNAYSRNALDIRVPRLIQE